ncbi:hypothetical protein C922_04628 [Plasmodium inui San Antonio 1]|uniref:Uncharacterized protein n=1 Tax=Plasmodium inui San Antonio 1 TaxID=1237626 RepID=W7A0C6_9APIC|nr:hypothetical protein C922_04628 [Plasmodium inui San Antonio 1]EUD65000.1 hypothetical protein C922_04628 [Plasmodium inui San Antonio 1]
MKKYKGSLLTVLISSTIGWNLNRLYRQNELSMHGVRNNHDIIVVRQVNISDKKSPDKHLHSENNKNSKNNKNNTATSTKGTPQPAILNEKELLNLVQHFNDINKKHKGFCETSIFKNSTFSKTNNEHNGEDSFNTYLIIDKWKRKNEFEKSKKEFEILFAQKNHIYDKKMENIYLNYEMYNNNYETASAQNIFQKLYYFIFD